MDIERKREPGTEPRNPPTLGSGQVGRDWQRRQRMSPCHTGRNGESYDLGATWREGRRSAVGSHQVRSRD